jgi:alkane 1-monooxygenase
MKLQAWKYAAPFLLYISAVQAFLSTGLVVWIPVFYAWILVPILELLMKPDPSNLSEAEAEMAKHDRVYDYLLYLVVPFQFAALALFLYQVTFLPQTASDLFGKVMVMGLLCGTLGINVGHELGHRTSSFEKLLAQLLLLSSLYMHFFIEHNKGHHKRVATHEDPSSARFGENLYHFWFRSIVFSYLSAWDIAVREMKKRGLPALSVHNQMLRFQIIQLLFLCGIWAFFGWQATLLFTGAALLGILLLESVNYIEHYGLQRSRIENDKYERAMPVHSWNSSHVIGRVMLFELSRHSDHHYMASRKYQVLRHYDDAPQLPTGYPGMMILATLPFAWFRVMNKRIRKVEEISLQQEVPVTGAVL